MSLIRDYKEKGMRICGISAPSRASTLFNYVGLDDAIIDYVCEIAGSLKIGKCMPGTAIPVVEEGRLFDDQPEVAIIFSWHIADELGAETAGQGLSRQAGDATAGPARTLVTALDDPGIGGMPTDWDSHGPSNRDVASRGA